MSSSEDRCNSITHWIQQLESDEEQAVQAIWERYFERLMRLARSKLPGGGRRAFDEEDVALSALESFVRGAQRGRFPQLNDRHDVWRLLLVITARKAQAYLRHERRQKRGGGKVMGESALIHNDDPVVQQFATLISEEPSPDFAAQFVEQVDLLFAQLDDDTLKQIAMMKMEGYTVDEIADKVGCARRSIERRLRLIRKHWSTSAEDQAGGEGVVENDSPAD